MHLSHVTWLAVAAGQNDTDSETYDIKFTFMASPRVNNTPEYQPSGSVQRISGGTLTDGTGSAGPARAAFSDLVARLYFNVLTAALGNECNTGYGPHAYHSPDCRVFQVNAPA